VATDELDRSPLTHSLTALPTADYELKLLKVLELLSVAADLNPNKGTDKCFERMVVNATKEEEGVGWETISQATRGLTSSILWEELDACMGKIRLADCSNSANPSSSSNPSSESSMKEQELSHVKGDPNSSSSSSGVLTNKPSDLPNPSKPPNPPNGIITSLMAQEMLKKPSYILSPLSSRMIPLLECYFRAISTNLHLEPPSLHSNPHDPHGLSNPNPNPNTSTNAISNPFILTSTDPNIDSLPPPQTPSTPSRQILHLPPPRTPSVSPIPFKQSKLFSPTPLSSTAASLASIAVNRPVTPSSALSVDGQCQPTLKIEHLALFCEKNRILLNSLLRSNIRLLEGSLSLLVALPDCRKVLDFNVKRSYLKLKLKRLQRWNDDCEDEDDDMTIALEVERERLIECSFEAFQEISVRQLVKGKLDIMFEDEEGVDGGGLTREWYALLTREIFRPSYALFLPSSNGVTFQPNPNSGANPEHLEYFRFVGLVIGKAVVDGQLLDAHFTRPIYKHMLGVPVSYHDLEAIEPEYYKSLCLLLASPLRDLGFEDSLTFSADTQVFGESVVADLMEGGRDVIVTDSNKADYVRLVAHHHMTAACRPQLEAFIQAFHSVVPLEAISLFDPMELELLISGLPDIDLDDLRVHTDYHGYKASDPTIELLWSVVGDFSKEEKALFVQFFSGTSKVPLDGFSALQGTEGIQRFSVHKAFDPLLLPTSHTCFNQLDLPQYPSKEIMREKLLLAIRECSEGFGFV
jgi:hypothetical protein